MTERREMAVLGDVGLGISLGAVFSYLDTFLRFKKGCQFQEKFPLNFQLDNIRGHEI